MLKRAPEPHLSGHDDEHQFSRVAINPRTDIPEIKAHDSQNKEYSWSCLGPGKIKSPDLRIDTLHPCAVLATRPNLALSSLHQIIPLALRPNSSLASCSRHFCDLYPGSGGDGNL